ncbi:MAG: mechanosensitive ion channel domain-containing protein [Pseudolabrys sp.]|jgi:small-conductance mechanosensitive channel
MSEIIAWFDQHHVNLSAILTSAVVLVVVGLAISLLKRFLNNWLNSIQQRFQLSNATISTFIRVLTAAFWLIAVLSILDAWGIGIAGLWGLVVSSIAVIGVGFLATWAIVSNFTSSFFLTIWRPFRLGDTVILLPDTSGRVTDRNLMFTVLRDQDGSVVNVPNNLFFQKMFRVTSGGEQSS